MNTDNQALKSEGKNSKIESVDEVSLVDIYIMIKRNSRIFFMVFFVVFMFSIYITYSKHQSNIKIEGSEGRHYAQLWIEIGKVYSPTGRVLIDSTKNTMEKINAVYFPLVKAEFVKSKDRYLIMETVRYKLSDMIIIIVKKSFDDIDYDKVLMKTASYVLKNHNEELKLSATTQAISAVNPTKVIRPFVEVEVKRGILAKNINIIPIIGMILGVFLGFIMVLIKEFLKKVKDVEKLS